MITMTAITTILSITIVLTKPKGPCTRELNTWVWGNINCCTDFGEVCDYSVLGPLGSTSLHMPLEHIWKT